jgi:hypothetical protein
MAERRKDRELRIRCARETFIAFKRYAADYRTYEDALLSLLEGAGIHVGRFEVK